MRLLSTGDSTQTWEGLIHADHPIHGQRTTVIHGHTVLIQHRIHQISFLKKEYTASGQLERDDDEQLGGAPERVVAIPHLGWRCFSHAWIDVFRGVIHSNTRTAKCDFRPSVGAHPDVGCHPRDGSRGLRADNRYIYV